MNFKFESLTEGFIFYNNVFVVNREASKLDLVSS